MVKKRILTWMGLVSIVAAMVAVNSGTVSAGQDDDRGRGRGRGRSEDVRASSNGDDRGGGRFGARLSGFEVVLPNLTDGRGRFRANVEDDDGADEIEFTLRYSGLEGDATSAHIHFAQRGVQGGGTLVVLCGTGGIKTSCTSPVTGTITNASVDAIAAQGVAGDVDELIEIMRAGAAYVDIHVSGTPTGSNDIRGQIGRGEGRGRGRD